MTFATLLSGYSRSEIVASMVFACVFAFLGYRMSLRHRLVRGVTPWRVPSAVWAVICFFFQPFGIVVELLAQATTKPVVPSTGKPTSASTSTSTSAFPAYPQPAGTVVAHTVAPMAAPVKEAAPAYSGPPMPPSDGTGKSPLFGWYADTTKRHEMRYWDGRGWSEHVSDSGVKSVDPL